MDTTSDAMELSLANRHDEIQRAMDEAEAFLERRGASAKRGYAVRLALEELLTNVVKYAYADGGEHRIGVRLDLGEPARLTIEDDGEPFDPLADAPAPVLDGPVEDRPIGGLGLHMIASMGMKMAYRREDGKNRLDVEFPAELG
jgi:anti-sigma regulatory factor (Ser/Thr protein kinase)